MVTSSSNKNIGLEIFKRDIDEYNSNLSNKTF